MEGALGTQNISSPSITLPHAHHFVPLKLTPKNYLSWRKQIVAYLKGKGQRLFSFLDGSHPCPDDADAAAQWSAQDSAITSLLLASLSDEVHSLVLDKETSFDIWTALQDAYGLASMTRLMSLNMSLQNLQQDPDESNSAYLQHAKLITDELAAASKPLTPADFNIYVLRSLRSDLHDMVSPILNRLDPPSYADLSRLLLSHERIKAFQKLRLTEAPITGSQSPSANTVQRTDQVNPSSSRG
ncbi:uncharacterized protein LOC122650607 [Telopea speciosissima]|uniref:uncharacterized protein LOC122650607 n=1 Tax=Telopea speciosissima TaxID=54955 RepID=UPI001CC77188|nr:uncharacterized protein LOC122650607 [Telopea speciosissima]